jgi:hypothetical protein
MPLGIYVPGTVIPYGFTGLTTYYWNMVLDSGWGNCAGMGACATYCVDCYSNGSWSGGDTVKYFKVKRAGGGSCYNYCDQRSFTYTRTAYTIAGSGSTKDYDCDGVMDNVDTNSVNPGLDGEKFRVKIYFTNKSTSVVYTKWEGDKGSEFWTSSDGSDIPEESVLSGDNYRATLAIYYNDGGYQEYVKFGTVAGSGQSASPSGPVGSVSGGDTPAGTSPGAGTGGASSTADYNQASGDNKIIADYLAGIQRNTKATVDNLIEIEKDLEKIKQNQALQSTSGGTSTGQTPPIDLTGVETRIDTTNTKLGEIKDKIPALGEEADILPGDTSGMEDNDDLSEEEMETKYQTEKTGLEGLLNDFIENNPLTSVVAGSGVELVGAVSSLSVSAGVHSFSLNFAGFESTLTLIGNFFVALCALSGLIVVLRD